MGKMKKKLDIDKIFEMIRQMDLKEQLLLIAKIAEGVSYKTFPRKPRKPISSYKAFGMWKDREDIKDAVSWIQARKPEGSRLHS